MKNVKNPVINLNGNWRFSMTLPHHFQFSEGDEDFWENIEVPGECLMQEYAIKHHEPHVYLKRVKIPDDYADKRILISFEGVYSYAKLWINGEFVKEHYGGFTAFEWDITDFVTPGEIERLVVEIRDFKNDVSYASGFAMHPIGGILRNVSIRAEPEVSFSEFYYETDLDENYRDANLILHYKINMDTTAEFIYHLFDPSGKKLEFEKNSVMVSGGEKKSLIIPFNNPLKWDAEHPNLYTLNYTLKTRDAEYGHSLNIGFREIERIKNKLLVNGMPVKLRGICRHDMHPELGRTTSPYYDELDVQLMKEANINFVRTTHYPPSRAFMEFCDQYGIYVEVENAVCFSQTSRTPNYKNIQHSGERFSEQILDQLDKMIDHHRNHPSLIIWSTANESIYDSNFKHSYKLAKAKDPTRPVIFSYPGTIPDSIKATDLLSFHYPDIYGNKQEMGIEVENFTNDSIPVLFDEWAHVACYNKPTLVDDANVRDFWAIGLDSLWSLAYYSEACLGGAIMGFVDEVFMVPKRLPGYKQWWGLNHKGYLPLEPQENTLGQGAWGIVDIWRRKKPEFWNVKKAYSPVRIKNKTLGKQDTKGNYMIEIENRFNHTDLSELKIVLEPQNMIVPDTAIPPGKSGWLRIPENYVENNQVIISFYAHDSLLIDKYQLKNALALEKNPSKNSDGSIKLSETDIAWEISGEDFEIRVDKARGEILSGRYHEYMIFTGGPRLHFLSKGEELLPGVNSLNQLAMNEKVNYARLQEDNKKIIVTRDVSYDSIQASIQYIIHANGDMEVDYRIPPSSLSLIREIGIRFRLSESPDTISWEREAYWSYYPPDHMSAPANIIPLKVETETVFGKKPETAWHWQIEDYYYKGERHPDYKYDMPRISTASKSNILRYSVHFGNDHRITVVGTGEEACRISPEEQNKYLIICDLWDYPDLHYGNYMKNIRLNGEYEGHFRIESR